MKNTIIILTFFMSLVVSSQNMETYIYDIKANDTLRMDVFTPENIEKSNKLPVLVWMHGGGFSGNNRADISDHNLVRYAAKEHNYVGVSIDYRLLRKGTSTGFGCDCTKDEKLETFKQAAIDFLNATKFLVERADGLQIDTTKIIAGGSSAGAEGILNAVFMRDYFITDKTEYNNVSFAGVMSFAGALVDASYITKDNAVPSVLYHGTDDQLVPFANAPHHYCEPTKAGYLILDGSAVMTDQLQNLESSFYFNMVKGGQHEISAIPFLDLDKIFDFFERTVINDEIIQTKIIKTKFSTED